MLLAGLVNRNMEESPKNNPREQPEVAVAV